jgi:hypothetical protein
MCCHLASLGRETYKKYPENSPEPQVSFRFKTHLSYDHKPPSQRICVRIGLKLTALLACLRNKHTPYMQDTRIPPSTRHGFLDQMMACIRKSLIRGKLLQPGQTAGFEH